MKLLSITGYCSAIEPNGEKAKSVFDYSSSSMKPLKNFVILKEKNDLKKPCKELWYDCLYLVKMSKMKTFSKDSGLRTPFHRDILDADHQLLVSRCKSVDDDGHQCHIELENEFNYDISFWVNQGKNLKC